MYINPFVAGVIATLLCECACAVLYSFTHRYEPEDIERNVISMEDADEEDIKELINVLKKMEEKSSVKDNDN